MARPMRATGAVAALEGPSQGVTARRRFEDLGAVGYWYDRFAPTADAEVREALAHDRWPAELGGVP